MMTVEEQLLWYNTAIIAMSNIAIALLMVSVALTMFVAFAHFKSRSSSR